MSRFGNVATADLIARELHERAELRELQEAIRARLIEESGIVVGKVYRVADDGRSLAGRRLWVEGVNAGMRGPIRGEEFYCFAWGRLNGRSAAGDGWTIKRQNISATRLTIDDAGTA